MTPTSTGWVLFAAALSMMLTLIANDVSKLHTWAEVWTPSFISVVMAHLGAVGMAFVGGKLIPTTSNPNNK